MKCIDFEQDIYLYSELSDAERIKLDTHIQQCAACKELFQVVSAAQILIYKTSATNPELVNHARLTSSIMQAVTNQQKQSASWINSLFIKYAMAGASLVLIIAFGGEQLSSVSQHYKRESVTQTVPLNSASFMKAALDKREKSENEKPSLYACVKSGGCDNTFIENFKKNSF